MELLKHFRKTISGDQKDEEMSDDDNDNGNLVSNDKSKSKRKNRYRRNSSRENWSLTCTDIEPIRFMNTFNGDDGENVKQWIEEFELSAKLCNWNDVQRAIYAKILLRRWARLFVNYNVAEKSWEAIKSALKQEYCVESYDIHKKLSGRKKKDDETFIQYCYKMLEIASQVEMTTESVIRYIIDGIVDEEVNKTILYDAKSISELRRKFDIYEAMKNKSKHLDAQKQKSSSAKNKQKDKQCNCSHNTKILCNIMYCNCMFVFIVLCVALFKR